MPPKLAIFTGNANPALAQAICDNLEVGLGEAEVFQFSNENIFCRINQTVRGEDVFVVQSLTSPVNTSIMELLIMIDDLKRASAARITAVIPYFAYGRSDKKDQPRVPITARLLANMIERAGADRILAIDLHAGQIEGFFDVPVDHLTAMPVLADWVAANLGSDVVVVSPDAGRFKVAERFAQMLEADVGSVAKRRLRGVANQVEALDVMGDVRGRICVLVDDMIDTAGTICAAADQLILHGAREVYAMATHGVLSDPAIDRLKNSVITKVVITDTLPLADDRRIDKIEVLSVATIIADALLAVFEDRSVSEIFGGANQA